MNNDREKNKRVEAERKTLLYPVPLGVQSQRGNFEAVVNAIIAR